VALCSFPHSASSASFHFESPMLTHFFCHVTSHAFASWHPGSCCSLLEMDFLASSCGRGSVSLLFPPKPFQSPPPLAIRIFLPLSPMPLHPLPCHRIAYISVCLFHSTSSHVREHSFTKDIPRSPALSLMLLQSLLGLSMGHRVLKSDSFNHQS
jgi:hypothetical protein